MSTRYKYQIKLLQFKEENVSEIRRLVRSLNPTWGDEKVKSTLFSIEDGEPQLIYGSNDNRDIDRVQRSFATYGAQIETIEN